METKTNWKNLGQRLTARIRLRTYPLGFKFIKDLAELDRIEAVQKPEFKRTVCQIIGSARWLGKAWSTTGEDQLCQWGGWCLGICPHAPETYASGVAYTCTGMRIAHVPEARRILDALPKIKDQYAAFVVMALDGGTAADHITFDPDLVIIYGEPQQLADIILPSCAALGLPALSSRILGDTGICADGIAAAFITGEPKFFLPCIGDRAYGGTLPSESAVVYPAAAFNEQVLERIEKFSFAQSQILEAALGACPEIVQRMEAHSSLIDPLSKGTPLLPGVPRLKDQAH